MNTTSRESVSKTDERIDKLADQISTLVEIVSKKVVTPTPVKAVEESCVTCGGAHAWYNCPNTDSNQSSVCAATGFQAQNNHAPNFQNQGFQNQPFQVPNNQVQQEFSNEFSSYKRSNDQMMRNMQNQINSLKGEFKNEIQNTMKTQQTVLMNQQNAFQNNLQNMISGFFQNQASTSGTLPSNTIPNPKGEMKAITTRSGVAYEGPSIPTNPSPKKVVERETEETTDKEQNNFQGSTAHIPPPVNPIPILEPDVPKTLPKPNIPYPSRHNDQKFREKASNQMEKIFQIFQDLRFDISFADALLLMPRFAPTIKNLLMNKEKLFELAKIPLNGNCSVMLLKKLPEKLGDPDQFLIPYFEADPRVPLILRRSFLRTGRALIDVYREEITLRESDFILEEIEAFLKDDSISPEIDHADCDSKEDICLIEKLLNSDPFQLPLMDLKEVTKAKPSIEEPPELELKDFPSHLEYAYLEGTNKLPMIIAKGLKDGFEKEALKRPMTHLLEKETPFVFSKDCINAFKTLKKKHTEAPILVFPDWGFDQIKPPQHYINNLNQFNNELYTMMEDFMKRINQQREQEALLVAQREQELREQEQAAQEKEEFSPKPVFRQLIEEMCGTKVCEEQKQNMEDTMLDLLEDCRQKELYCIHNNVDDLIESALNSKLLLINLNSQRFDKEKQEVKNIVEQATKRRTRITESLQNFKVIHKESTIPLKKTPQISPVNAITHDLPTEEPEYSLSMGDKHLDTISETESDKVIKSSVENLVPIPSESEDFSDNESECDMPVCDDFTTFSNPLFDSNDDFTSSDDKSLSNEDVPKENFKIYLIDSSPKFDYLLELAHIDPIPPGIEEADFDLEEEIRLVENLSYDNSSPRPPEERNSKNVDMIIESPSLSPILVEDSDSYMEEIDLFIASDDSMPPGIKNDDYDSEGDIRFLEELLSNNPLPLPEIESSNLDHFNDPSSPRPLSETPDVEICFDVEPDTTVKNDFEELNKDECFDPGGEIDVFANVEDDDYFPFTFII
ncbi:hypothetical protein Tco_1438702 [Tanacetum coccineum]